MNGDGQRKVDDVRTTRGWFILPRMNLPKGFLVLLAALAAPLCVLGCGAEDAPLPGVDAGHDAGTTVDLGVDAGTEADAGADLDANTILDASIDGGVRDAGVTVACGISGEPSFPTFARGCTAASDCVVVEHQSDCCGTFVALGLRADEQAAFDADEGVCRGMYPRCRCLARATAADDGTVDDGSHPARVDCVANVCTSTFTAGNGDICASGSGVCGPGLACCYPCGIPGCEFRCEPECAPGSPGCVSGCLLRP